MVAHCLQTVRVQKRHLSGGVDKDVLSAVSRTPIPANEVRFLRTFVLQAFGRPGSYIKPLCATTNGHVCPVLAVRKPPLSQTKQIPRHPATPLRRQLHHPQLPAPIKRGQAGLYRRSIHCHTSAPHEATNRIGNIGCGFLVASTKHPHTFAKNRDWHSNEIGFR